MFQTRRDTIRRLQARAKLVTASADVPEKIAQLEEILAFEMAAAMYLRNFRKLSDQQCTKEFAAVYLEQAKRCNELRALTNDDDAAWRVRSGRVKARCLEVLRLSPAFFE